MDNFEASVLMQEKFDFYFISLIFIMLGMSIQTAKFNNSVIPTSAEIFCWLFFIISGISGLLRLQGLSTYFGMSHLRNKKFETLTQAKKLRESGVQTVLDGFEDYRDIRSFIYESENEINNYQNKLKIMNNKFIFRYSIQKYSFILGILFLVISRSFEPIGFIIKSIMV